MKTLMIANVALLSLMGLASSATHRSYYQEKDAQKYSNSMTIYKYYDQLNDALEQSNGKYFSPTPCTRK